MDNSVIIRVDQHINFKRSGDLVLSVKLGRYMPWTEVPSLERKVMEWGQGQPVIWNAGIGSAASFMPTLGRLLSERIEDLYGPHDLIIRLNLTPAAGPGGSGSRPEHRLAFEVLMETTRSLKISLPDDILQLNEDEKYFGYGTISDDLLLKAFGSDYVEGFDLPLCLEANSYYQLHDSPVPTTRALQGEKLLLVVENLHAPISLSALYCIWDRFPSQFNNRWIMSATSRDVVHESRLLAENPLPMLDSMEYHRALPFDDLGEEDWAALIKEALYDAGVSIYDTLEKQPGRDHKFWLHVAHHCLYYGILFHPLQRTAERQATSNTFSVTSDEMVRCWVAEDLLSSSTRPSHHKPAAIGRKQSNYYRSAYETGKVVIQALQKYSLLPVYSASVSISTSNSSWMATPSAPNSQDEITGVSKLAEGAPQLKQDELVHRIKSGQLKWVSFMNDNGRHVSWDWKVLRMSRSMSTLILRGRSNVSDFPFDEVLNSNLRVLDLSYTTINSLPRGFSKLLNLHLLSLRGCSQLETLSPLTSSTSEAQTTPPLAHLENLQVLDMNGVPLLEITQQDSKNKRNLHYLDLSGSRLTTLPSEFFCEMPSLEELVLGNSSILKELPPSLAKLCNLLILHVEGTQITTLPEDMFNAMQSLHTLKLISNMLLMSLPMSISEAKSLKEVHLCNCISLRSLPMSLSKAKGLKELHDCNCSSLKLQSLWELLSCVEDLFIQTWGALEDIKIHGHPNLRKFSVSGPWVKRLSLRGCRKLKSVNFSNDLITLEQVDLSGTALQEVPHNLPNLPQLRMLLLLNVPNFKRFPWHQLVRFPIVFYLDQFASDDNQLSKMFAQLKICADDSQHNERTTNTAQFNLIDHRIFHSFNADAANKLVKNGQFLLSFNVRINPCSVRGMEPRNNNVDLFTKAHMHSTYCDVKYSETDIIMPMMKLQPRQRHVELSAKNHYPSGLRHLLSVTNSMVVTDDDFVRCLTDLNYGLISLEECQLQRCHQMEIVFIIDSEDSDRSEGLPYLQILQASCLKNLKTFVKPSTSYSKLITLKVLKHIHLEDCPRLEEIFPCSLSLPALETLVILFCSNLKKIFYQNGKYAVAASPLPSIKRIYLQELPHLQCIHNDIMFQFETPKWEKLFVRGCHSFHHLPLLKNEYPKSKVKVSGERDWWGKLKWSRPEQSHYYLHATPPEFVSRKKHIIRSYLR